KDLKIISKKLESNREFLNWVLKEGRTGFEIDTVIEGVNAVLEVSVVVDTFVEKATTFGEELLGGFFNVLSSSKLTQKLSVQNMVAQSLPPSPPKNFRMASITSSERAVPSSSLSLKQLKNLRAVVYLN
ncbi:MAG: hypothetical protein ACXU9U_00140, partial [Parachlamydiaceae bacterium]